MSFVDSHNIIEKPLEIGGISGALDIIKRSERFGHAKLQSKSVASYIGEILDRDEYKFGTFNHRIDKLYNKLNTCADWLRFRHYLEHEETRLTSANFCRYFLLCQSCAIRRGALLLQKHHKNIEHIIFSNPRLKAYMLTLTIANGEDLKERFLHLSKSFKLLQKKRRNYLLNSERYTFTEFAKIKGAVFSYEIPKTKDGNAWNPHIHMLILCEEEPDMGFVKFDKSGKYVSSESHGLRDELRR